MEQEAADVGLEEEAGFLQREMGLCRQERSWTPAKHEDLSDNQYWQGWKKEENCWVKVGNQFAVRRLLQLPK